MAKKIFDIMPPYPEEKRHYHHESLKTKEKRKSRSTFLGLVLVVLLFSIFYALIKADSATQTKQSVTQEKQDNQFELFGSDGQSTLTKQTSTPIIVRIVNAAPGSSNATSVRDILLKNNFQIEQLEQTTSTSAQTVIYYKKNNLAYAQKANETINSIVSPTLQESNSLEPSYDILITIGEK